MGRSRCSSCSAIAYTIGGIAITVKLWKHTDISPKGQSSPAGFCSSAPLSEGGCSKYVSAICHVPWICGICIHDQFFGRDCNGSPYYCQYSRICFFIFQDMECRQQRLLLAGNALGANDNKNSIALPKAIVPLEVGLMVISGSLLFILRRY